MYVRVVVDVGMRMRVHVDSRSVLDVPLLTLILTLTLNPLYNPNPDPNPYTGRRPMSQRDQYESVS